ncbi:MAG: hypothetical protein AB1728_01465, partial [Bacteroidota bacterium]
MNALIILLVYRKKLLLLLMFSTNIFLMSQEGYYNTPRFIPRSQLGNITEANQYILTPYSFSLNTNGYPDRMYFKGDSLCFSADISVSSFRGSHRFVENTKRIESSSFFCRSSHESQLYSGGQKTGELFTLIEGFKDSPRLYCYSRMVFSSVDTVVIKLTFTLPKTINSTTCTTKNIANIPAGKHTTVSSVQSATTRSTYAHSDQKLLLIFPKGYPHIRSWSKEYFTVDTSINSSTNNVDSSLTITFDTIIVAPGQTFDHMFIVAITDIECGNIFTDELLEKFGFYSPVEGYSTRRFTGIKGFEFLPAKAWTWGWATFPNQYMKYLLTKNDSLYHGYFLDEKIRHFVYFLEHQS